MNSNVIGIKSKAPVTDIEPRATVTDIKSKATVIVMADLKPGSAPDTRVSHMSRLQRPDHVTVEYVPEPVDGRWKAVHVTVTGHRLLKPAPDGTARLGKERQISTYGGWDRDVQEAGLLPEWLDRLVSELRPAGLLTLPRLGDQ